ncbi:MAG: T9SS type A sorting domain-containing protein [Bacteroidetes bacterium]|nr:T9SS type A sorting domain-containing protein [Bacteroidota bacterium]
MKKLLLLVPLFLFGFAHGQALAPPIDFESGTISYTWTDFGGGVATVINNPQSSGINTSTKVGQMVKNAPEVWAGSYLQMTNPIDFSVNKIWKMKVYSPRVGARVLFKVENISNGAVFFEREDTSTVANAWEELTFDFSAINTSNSYQKVVLIWDLGVAGNGSANFTFLFDDIQLISSGGPLLTQIDLPVTFDVPTVDYTMTDFGNNATVVGADPLNSLNNVGITTKGLAAQTWAGTTISTGLGFVNPIPFAINNTVVSARIWSPDAGIPIRLKVEDHTNNTITCETETMTTVAGGWDTLLFDFSLPVANTAALNLSNTYDLMSIFFNFGTDGNTAGVKVYYFDDVMFGAPVMPLDQIDLPITFEGTTTDYTMTDFGGNTSQVIVDPNNSLNHIAETIKGITAPTWSGTTISTPMGLATAIPFTITDTKMSVKVWSPDAGIQVRLKAEDHTNPTRSVETEATTTVANAWETLVFDFSNEAPGTAALNLTYTFDMVSIFFNFGVDGATAGLKTYFFDDVMFGAPANPLAQIDLPITFEDSMVDYTMTDFGGNASQVIVDPTDSLNHVGETIKGAGAQSWAGTTISTPSGLATAIPFTLMETFISVRVWSPDAGIQIRLKAEDHLNNTITVETEKTTTVAGGWETLVFDFSNEVTGTPALNLSNTYDLLSIFFNFGVDGATAGQKTYYFDDVEFGNLVAVERPELVGLQYYPNPTTGGFRIQAEQAMESIQVFDVMGKLVYQQKADANQVALDLSALHAGVYLVAVQSKEAFSSFNVVKY